MKSAFRFGSLFLLVVASGIFLSLLLKGSKASAPWFAAVGSGNGYDALLQAAAQMNGRPDKDDATTFVKANDRMFELVESTLKLPFEMPLILYSETNSSLPDLTAFKTIALALRAKGEEAEKRGAGSDAGTAYTDVIRLGQRVEHGPVISLLVGIAIEKIGLAAMEKLAPRLSPSQRNELAHQLESIDRQRLAFSEVAIRERYFAGRITSNPVRLLVGRWQLRTAIKNTEQKHQQLSSDFQRLAKELRLPPNTD